MLNSRRRSLDVFQFKFMYQRLAIQKVKSKRKNKRDTIEVESDEKNF